MRKALIPLVAALLVGCGGSQREVRVAIRPSQDLNDSRSVYVVARAVQDAAYASESYDDVAAKAMTPDASVQRAVVVLPGVAQEIKVPVPEKGRIAIYALFKQPEDDSWRVLLPATTTDGVEIRLGRGRMCWIGEDAPRGAAGVCGAAQAASAPK
jgi:predicted component of type VI protein secretion system